LEVYDRCSVRASYWCLGTQKKTQRTAMAVTTIEPSPRTRKNRSNASSLISFSLLLRESSWSKVFKIVLSASPITSLSSQNTLELEEADKLDSNDNGKEEKRSNDACNCRCSGESRTGRNIRRVESDVMVYSVRSSLNGDLSITVANDYKKMVTNRPDIRECLQEMFVTGRGCGMSWD
jgi:hypothetical protein